MLEVQDAVARVAAAFAPLPAEARALLDAQGLVLAEDVRAGVTLPPWDNSAMDGFAVRADDVAPARRDAPARLRVVGAVSAGAIPERAVGAGEAIAIMTGAPIPPGADTVVRVEDTARDGGDVLVLDARDAGKNLRPRGEDVRAGDIAIAAGTALGAAQLGVLASVGAARVRVHRRPRIAIVGSGDELVELDRFAEVEKGRRIVSSNSYTLQAAVREAGGEPVYLGIARDDPDDLRAHVERARGCDLLLTCGGISMGDADHTRPVLQSLGASLDFWRVRMRPGAPIGFGSLDAMPWIGLPGNPVSALVTFELFARPAIRRMLGHALPFRRPVRARVTERVATAAALTHFMRARLTHADDGALEARLTGPQGSGLLTSMARADALLVIPADLRVVEPGTMLAAIPLGESGAHAAHFAA